MATLVPIPRHAADVTSEWLSAALAADVNEVDVAPIGTGQTGATYRVSARYATERHAMAGDLPDTFAIKLPALDDTVRERVALGYLSEVEFYTDVADRMRIPVPRCFYSDISEGGADFVLVLADMAPAVQGDQIAGCAPQEAQLAVEALAGLHGPSWCDPVWLGLSAISMPKPGDEAAARGLGDVSVMAADITIDKLGARMSPQDRDTLRAAMGLVTPWLLAEPKRFALMHGDYRLDNMLFDMHGDPDRTRVTVVDWQTMGVGLPARDLAYFTATSLAPEVRPQIEEDLVGRYHQALLGYGVTDYDADTCWRDYRLGVMQAPLITGLGFAFAASTERGDEMILTMLHRGCRAIRELGTLDLINSYPSI
jgi:hypothetical protein